MWPWIQPYFTRRLLERRTATLPRLHAISRVAEHFATDDAEYEAFAPILLEKASRNEHALRRLFIRSEFSETKTDWNQRLFLAAILLCRKTAVPWSCLQNAKIAVTRGVYDAAVRARNYDAMDNILQADTRGPRKLLYYAIRIPDFDVVKYILASPHTSDDVWHLKPTPGVVSGSSKWHLRTELLRTCSVPIFEYVLVALQKCADFDVLEFKRFFDLLLAATREGWTDMARHLLLRRGGDTFTDQEKQTLASLIWHACDTGHADVFRVLLNAFGRHLVEDQGLESSAPSLSRCVETAAKRGYASVVRMLLDYGAKPEAAALVGAVEAEHEEILRMLVDRGAEVSEALLDEARQRARNLGLKSMTKLCEDGVDERRHLSME